MRLTLAVHILTGTVGLIAGYIALYTAKGASLHRRSGMAFVYAMLAMCVAGALIAVVRDVAPAINIPAATLTTYLMITALTTVRPLTTGARPVEMVGLLVAAAVGLTMLTWGFEAVANGGKRNGMPAFPFFMFGVIGTLGALGDLGVLRSGARKGASRLARHLWRMSTALFIAALSFSFQAAKMIPKPYRFPALIALPMLAVLVTMGYWLWRVRVRRSLRGIIVLAAPEAAGR